MQNEKHGEREGLLLLLRHLPVTALRNGLGKEWMQTMFPREGGGEVELCFLAKMKFQPCARGCGLAGDLFGSQWGRGA
jgi:hypothetical protein